MSPTENWSTEERELRASATNTYVREHDLFYTTFKLKPRVKSAVIGSKLIYVNLLVVILLYNNRCKYNVYTD